MCNTRRFTSVKRGQNLACAVLLIALVKKKKSKKMEKIPEIEIERKSNENPGISFSCPLYDLKNFLLT